MPILDETGHQLSKRPRPLTVSQARKWLTELEKHGMADKVLVIGMKPDSATRGLSVSAEILGFQAGVAWDEDKVFVQSGLRDSENATCRPTSLPTRARPMLAELLHLPTSETQHAKS